MHERHSDLPNLWEALLIIGLLFGLEVIIASGFHDAGVPFSPGDPRNSVIVVLGVGAVLSLLLAYKNLSYAQLFNPVGPFDVRSVARVAPPILVMSIGSVFLAIEVVNLVVRLFPPSLRELEQGVELFSGGLISVIALCLVAPFVEEMLFRGVFLRSFLRIYSPRRAIVLSALLFGLAHLNVHQFVVASTLGLLSGWLYYATGSLWPSIIEHAVYNGGVYWYRQMVPDALQAELPKQLPIHSTPTLIGALAFFTVGLWWLVKVVMRQTSRASVQAAP